MLKRLRREMRNDVGTRRDSSKMVKSSDEAIPATDEVRKGLAGLEPWFHRIELRPGLFTKTLSVMGEPVDHPAGAWQTIKQCLPRDLGGKNVLDVGCNAGFYSVEIKRLGAERVMGVDAQRHHIRQAVFVRKILGLDIEYRRMSVYDLDRWKVGQFDVTLALGLIYHCKHVLLALEKLFAVTAGRLIIETAIFPPQRAPRVFDHWVGEMKQMLYPLAYVGNPPDAKEPVQNWFLPSVDCLCAMLRAVGFASIDVLAIADERAVLVCHKEPRTLPASSMSEFVAALAIEEGPDMCVRGSEINFRVRVRNKGSSGWPAPSRNGERTGSVWLGCHLLRENEEEVEWDFGWAPTRKNIEPGEIDVVNISLQSPAEPGNYILEFDMVRMDIAWFEDFGSGTTRHKLSVTS